MNKASAIFLVLVLMSFFSSAQKDTGKSRYSSSMYDPSGICYNKGKIFINIGIGYFAYVDNTTYNQNSQVYYFRYEDASPIYNLISDYGITPKSMIGLAISYQQYHDYNNPPSPLAQKLSILNAGFRFTHSIGTSKYFYYGVRFGVSVEKYNLSNDFPYALPVSSISYNPTFQGLIGVRIILLKNLSFNIEAGAINPYIIEGGVTFRINTSKNNRVTQTHDSH